MKIGIVSPYFGTIGGGERYMLTAARFFVDRGDRVDIFSGDAVNAQIAKDFFGLDLSRANFISDAFFGPGANVLGRLTASIGYDLIFFLSDGSIPLSLARRNWLHFQTPFQYTNQNNPANKLKLNRFEAIICNSKFTKRYIDRAYGTNSKVVYPPVDVKSFTSGKKENLILATGRFSDPADSFQHAKKQEVLVKTFISLVKDGLQGWRLVLAGSATDDSSKFIQQINMMAKNLPVELVVNPNFEQLKKYYAAAKIFWHAVGFGEDLDKNPARAEHFGITTVEAMAAGAVPVVFSAGGQKEIIRQDGSGFLWKTVLELKKKTVLLVSNEKLREEMAEVAALRAKNFSTQQFYDHLKSLL